MDLQDVLRDLNELERDWRVSGNALTAEQVMKRVCSLIVDIEIAIGNEDGS